jgi:hypothetical protein
MNKKESILLWILAFGLYFLIMPLRAYSFCWAIVAHSMAFMIFTWWALKKYAPTADFWHPLVPMLAPWLFELAMRCILSITIWSLPVTILPLWAVITVAMFYRYRKVWLLLLCSALLIYSIIDGQNQWYEWAHYTDYPIMTVNLADCEVTDSTHTFRLSDVDAEYIVMDVWYSRCGVCINQMPEVQALYDEYQDNSKIKVVSLFVCLLKGETISDGYAIVKERECNFPVYATPKGSQILTRCEIDSYPRVLILDKNRTVIFNGSLKFAKRKLKGL